jgi:membrane-associated protease RseP (regulator of RpoE activity)
MAKALLRGVAICFATGWLTATAAVAAAVEVAAGDLRALEVGTSSLDQVVARFGKPDRRETSAEGLVAIAYFGSGAKIDPDSVLTFVGAVDGVFIPGAMTPGATSTGAVTALVFDRKGHLMYYRAANASTSVTSDDDAARLPNLKVKLDETQKQTAMPPNDGKVHLGIQPVSVADLDAEHKSAFAAANFHGLVVANVIPGSVAAKAGMENGDYIYTINGSLVTSGDDALKAIADVKPGDTILAHGKRIDPSTLKIEEKIYLLKF